MWDVILEALLDSLKVLPFLFAFYVLIELLETSQKAKAYTIKMLNGKAAPIVSGLVGAIPQCGFSVLTADLYTKNFIKLGTLIAIFVATSDEALPILFTSPDTFADAWLVLGIKVVYAILLGFLINLFDKRTLEKQIEVEEHEKGCCNHEMKEKSHFWEFIKHPIVHSAKIFAYIFAINVIFGVLLFFFETQIANFMSQTVFLQPFVVALIGLIPNCGSSVLITSMYTQNLITFPALLAGLISNSGIALAVLFKNKSALKTNLKILLILYLSATLPTTLLTLLI